MCSHLQPLVLMFSRCFGLEQPLNLQKANNVKVSYGVTVRRSSPKRFCRKQPKDVGLLFPGMLLMVNLLTAWPSTTRCEICSRKNYWHMLTWLSHHCGP